MKRHILFSFGGLIAVGVMLCCSLEIPHQGTVKVSIGGFEPQAGPNLANMRCYFINVTGNDISTSTPSNFVSGCSDFKLGSSSNILSYTDVQGQVTFTRIPFGGSLIVSIYGVTSHSCTKVGDNVPQSLFGADSEIPNAYLLGTKTVNFSKSDSLTISSNYDASSATSLTASCKNRWTSLSTTNAPTARYRHTAVWTGSKMIVWGGTDNFGGLNTGGVYDPENNNWTTMSTNNAPNGRQTHVAVWTGNTGNSNTENRMLVWGGNETVGGIYHLESDSWSAMDTSGQPNPLTARMSIAGWTGTKMIVWNSYDDSHAGGSLYDPATNSWSAMSTSGQPSDRSEFGGIWTGSKLIVFGGTDGAIVNTGGVYDLQTNSWTATNTTSAPAARNQFATAAGGTKMIFWGGNNGSPMDSGAIFDPALNPSNSPWTTMNTTNAPTARFRHTVVWTGSRLVVFGGDGSTDGGIYDPVDNSWQTMATSGAPTQGESSTMIWAGYRAIVWGGVAGGSSLNTGGVFIP